MTLATGNVCPASSTRFEYIDNGLAREKSDPQSPARSEPKELTEEEAKAKVEAAKLKKEQAAAKKAEPIEQAKVYIRRLPLDITETTRLMIQINSQNCVPKNLAAEYLKMFTEHNKKCKKQSQSCRLGSHPQTRQMVPK